MPTLVQELADKKAARAKDALAIIERFEGENRRATDDEATEVKRLVRESQDYADQMKQAVGDDEIKRLVLGLSKNDDHPLLHAADAKNGGHRSPGQAFVESDGYKGWVSGRPGQTTGVEVDPYRNFTEAKATFDTAGSTLTVYDRQPGIVLVGTQVPMVSDLFAKGTTGANTIRYVQEDTFTNAAVEVAEGLIKPEASWDTSEVDAPVRKIAVTAKVTDELFADFPAMAAYINQRLPYMVALREDVQLLVGNGTPPNLKGILNTAGIQTQAKGADPVFTAAYKAMVLILSVGFFVPDGFVFNPLDWQDVVTAQDTTGRYIYGDPANAAQQRLWGLPVVTTMAITQNTALCGSFQLGAQIFYRQGITVESTNSNEDDFRKNLIAIRAEQREALACYRPKAFCSITGV